MARYALGAAAAGALLGVVPLRSTGRELARGLALDVHLALRGLRRSRSVSIPAAVSLALAIGANAAVFAVINSLLLRPLPVAHPERLASITSDFAIGHGFTAGA